VHWLGKQLPSACPVVIDDELGKLGRFGRAGVGLHGKILATAQRTHLAHPLPLAFHRRPVERLPINAIYLTEAELVIRAFDLVISYRLVGEAITLLEIASP